MSGGVVKSASVTARVGDYEVDIAKWPEGWELVIDMGEGDSIVFTIPDGVLKTLIAAAGAAIAMDAAVPMVVEPVGDSVEREVSR